MTTRTEGYEKIIEMAQSIHSSMWNSVWKSGVTDDVPRSAWRINLAMYLRLMLGVYQLRLGLIPFAMVHGMTGRRLDGGWDVWRYRQVHVFGLRVARWSFGEVEWVPDKERMSWRAVDAGADEQVAMAGKDADGDRDSSGFESG